VRTLRVVGPFYDPDKDTWLIRGDLLVGEEQLMCYLQTSQNCSTEYEAKVIASLLKNKFDGVELTEWPEKKTGNCVPVNFYDLEKI